MTPQLIDRVVRAAAPRAAAPAVGVKDTIKTVAEEGRDRYPGPQYPRAVQTPQVFEADLLKGPAVPGGKRGARHR